MSQDCITALRNWMLGIFGCRRNPACIEANMTYHCIIVYFDILNQEFLNSGGSS